jgi:hypothetical protein
MPLIFGFLEQNRVFVSSKPLQTSLMFAAKVVALPKNNKLGWKGLPGTNTLAYYKNLQITTVKCVIVQDLKTFYTRNRRSDYT